MPSTLALRRGGVVPAPSTFSMGPCSQCFEVRLDAGNRSLTTDGVESVFGVLQLINQTFHLVL